MNCVIKQPRLRPPRRRSGGFTLVEVLVTMVLMLIVLPVVMRGMSVSQMAAEKARRSAEGASLAQSLMNELITSADPTTFASQGDFGQEWPDYSWTMTNDYRTDLLLTEYTLTVTWRERGQPRTFTVSTFMADPAVAQ